MVVVLPEVRVTICVCAGMSSPVFSIVLAIVLSSILGPENHQNKDDQVVLWGRKQQRDVTGSLGHLKVTLTIIHKQGSPSMSSFVRSMDIDKHGGL